MDPKTLEELLKILDGNVGAVTAALEGKTPEELQALLDAENAGNTRKGVVNAITALLNPAEPQAAGRGVKDVEADIAKLEEGAIDMVAASRLRKLRDELAELKK